MNRIPLLGCLASVALLLLMSGDAQAQYYRRPVYRPVVRPYYPPNRMPGWDWQYIYPYSPYNMARRYPYPYPVPAPYPVYVPTPTTTYSGYNSNPAYVPRPQDVLIPHATGPLKTPPPNSALILVRVPGEFTDVFFDGVKTTSVGTFRYYSTPELPAGQPQTYTVTAVVNSNGQPVREQRQVTVIAGQTTTVDFTRPAGS